MSAAPPIRQLPEALVNRIAAGEVIERPAAAVKELVENALDAGATRIAVALADGGIGRIEVVDDGCGMEAADLALSVQRHCTSKLAPDAQDPGVLVRIATLGFRGEALPSIGAAARLAVISRPRPRPGQPGDAAPPATHAHVIEVAGGAVGPVRPTAGPPGTRVVVEDLFYATPARRKFLKHPRTEADHAEAMVRRLALAAPAVAFRLEIDGRIAFDLPAQERRARIAALFGPEIGAALLPLAEERGPYHLSGFVCPPPITRASTGLQGLIVNGRPVADPVLRTAVRVAFRPVIAAGRQPVVALYLDLPPEEVDVNVHPAKTELRFRAPDQVRGLVIGALGRALAAGAGNMAPEMRPRPAMQRVNDWQRGPLRAGFAEAQLPLVAPPAARLLPLAADPEPSPHPLGAPVAQVLDTYVIAVGSDGCLVLVDQHAAHERLTHEALRSQLLAGGVQAQPLLLPAVVELPPGGAGRLADRAAELHRLGLEIEGFGPGAVLVRALPAVLGAVDPGPLLHDIADELAEAEASTALADRLDAVIARMACHGSIRAGRRLTQSEMDALLRRMEATPRAATCSHGRPTFLKLSRGEIERLFGRR